jgi:hypothetical protein
MGRKKAKRAYNRKPKPTVKVLSYRERLSRTTAEKSDEEREYAVALALQKIDGAITSTQGEVIRLRKKVSDLKSAVGDLYDPKGIIDAQELLEAHESGYSKLLELKAIDFPD